LPSKEVVKPATEIATYFLPAGGIAKGATKPLATKVPQLAKLANLAIEGMLQGGMFKLSADDVGSFKEIIKSGLKGGGANVGLGIAGKAAGKIISSIGRGIFEKMPMAHRASALVQRLKASKKEVKN